MSGIQMVTINGIRWRLEEAMSAGLWPPKGQTTEAADTPETPEGAAPPTSESEAAPEGDEAGEVAVQPAPEKDDATVVSTTPRRGRLTQRNS